MLCDVASCCFGLVAKSVFGDSPSRALGRVKTAIYEASDTENVSLTHEKYRYDTAIKHRYKTIFFWCYNTHGMPQF